MEKRDLEAQAQAALDAARDDATAAEWTFHNAILGAKDQVKAQFGDDSNEYAGMGLTKKSERQSPSRADSVEAASPVTAGSDTLRRSGKFGGRLTSPGSQLLERGSGFLQLLRARP